MSEETEDEEGNKRPKIEQLNDGLVTFKQEVEGNYKAKQAVDVSLITFGGDVETEQEFTTIESWQPPELSAQKDTPMCEAIVRGANHLDEYRESLRDDNTPLKKGLVWLLTDGEATDHKKGEWLDKAKATIEGGTEDGDLLFYAVGIGDDADMDFLEDLASAAPDESKVEVFHLEEGMFAEFFRIVSESAHGHSKDEFDDAESQE